MARSIKPTYWIYGLITVIMSSMMIKLLQAAKPVWIYEPMTATTQSVPSNSSATIQYLLTNQSYKSKILTLDPSLGLVQITVGDGTCSIPIILPTKGSYCILSLQALGYQLVKPINGGPNTCSLGSPFQCYRPSIENSLHLTQGSPIELPPGCIDTESNNIECYVDSNYGVTNMTYALCRSTLCSYSSGPIAVCTCDLITADQGVYSASVGPYDSHSSAPYGNTVTSNFSLVNSNGQPPNSCFGVYANCYGIRCTTNGTTATCLCPVAGPVNYYTTADCTNLPADLIPSGTISYLDMSNTMNFIYDTFFNGTIP